MGNFGSFEVFCQRARLPICNLFVTSLDCEPRRIGLSGHKVGDLGTIFVDALVIGLSVFGIYYVNQRKAAVGRRELQLVLGVYALLSICDIFTTGRVFPSYNDYDSDFDYSYSTSFNALLGLTSVQMGVTVAFFWMLFLFGVVGFQLMKDGTPASLSLILISGLILFTGTMYISLDTGFDITGYFENDRSQSRNLALYILYLVLPLACAIGYAVSLSVLIVKRLGERKPLWYLLAATFFFAGGQILEFYASIYICDGSERAIDGAFFQTLMSLFAMLWVVILWRSTTEDDWSLPDLGNTTSSEPDSMRAHKTRQIGYQTQKTQCRPIRIEKPLGMSVEDGVAELNRFEMEFLDQVESEVLKLIKHSQKRDVTAIVSGGREYRGPPDHTDGWSRRMWAMLRHNDTNSSVLPLYEGEELDSWLTGKITTRVEQLYQEFLVSHSDITGKVMLQRLSENPIAYKATARQFAASIRDSGEPLTEEMCKSLIHLVSEQMANHTTDQLGEQLGHALLHVGGVSVISTFATAMAHAMTSAIGKMAVKLAAKITLKTALKAGGKVIGKIVLSTLLASVSTGFAAKGFGTLAAFLSTVAMPIIITAIVAWEVSEFTENLANKIAPQVREIMAGTFEDQNRSLLLLIGMDSLEDFGIQLGKTLALESSLVESAKEAAKEMATAKLHI